MITAGRFTEELKLDTRQALRSLRRTPVFFLGALLSISLAIAANTIVLSLFQGTTINRLLYRDPGAIVLVWTTPPQQAAAKEGVTIPDYLRIEEHSEVFDKIGAFISSSATLGSQENGLPSDQLLGQEFTASLFDVLGVSPQRGRLITKQDDAVDAETTTVLISNRLWRARFGGIPNIVGKKVLLDGMPLIIVGVMPPNFDLLQEKADFWTPCNFTSSQLHASMRVLTVVGHLRSGVSLQQAQAMMGGVAQELARLDPVRDKGREIRLEPIQNAYFGDVRHLLAILQGAVALVLLLACANTAGLLLIRASSRHQEVAIRTSLGADPWRITRQFLTESVVLSMAGGALGIVGAIAGLKVLFIATPQWLLHVHPISVDVSIITAAFGLSVLTGLAFGTVPARYMVRANTWTTLKESSRSTTASRGFQRTLVTLQFAFAVVLLIGAGLVIKSFKRLNANNIGFQTKNLVVFQSRVPGSQYFTPVLTPQGRRLDMSPIPALLFNQVCQRLDQISGVESAAGINVLPAGGFALHVPFTVKASERQSTRASSDTEAFNADYYFVTSQFFTTMRTLLIAGRNFTERDTANSPWVAIVNQSMAQRYWPEGNPVGHQIQVNVVQDEQLREIVGIVQDIPISNWDRTPRPALYVLQLQQPQRYRAPYAAQRLQTAFVVRTSRDPQSLIPFLRGAVSEVNTVLPISQVQTMNQFLARQIDGPRYYMVFLGGFGIVALLLAGIGIYATVAYSVGQRVREIAIRMALGAQKPRLIALLIRECFIIIGLGTPTGIAAALILTRYLRSVLWGVTTTDPVTYVCVTFSLLVAAVAATLIPAIRALNADPRAVLAGD